MTLAETIYQHSLLLPEQAAREALDFIEFLEQRYSVASVASNTSENTNNLSSVTTEEVMLKDESTPYISPLYKALESIGFIGCVDADEELSSRYKEEIDFSHKCSIVGRAQLHRARQLPGMSSNKKTLPDLPDSNKMIVSKFKKARFNELMKCYLRGCFSTSC